MLRNTLADLKNELQAMTSERNRIDRIAQDGRDKLQMYEQQVQHNTIELNCARAEDTKAKQRIEELVADVTRLQQSGMRLQQDLISQIQTEETRRKTQIER